MVEIKNIKNLHWLNLYNTQITDAGLAHLKNFKELRTLSLHDTKVTDAGVKELKSALPHTRIFR